MRILFLRKRNTRKVNQACPRIFFVSVSRLCFFLHLISAPYSFPLRERSHHFRKIHLGSSDRRPKFRYKRKIYVVNTYPKLGGRQKGQKALRLFLLGPTIEPHLTQITIQYKLTSLPTFKSQNTPQLPLPCFWPNFRV